MNNRRTERKTSRRSLKVKLAKTLSELHDESVSIIELTCDECEGGGFAYSTRFYTMSDIWYNFSDLCKACQGTGILFFHEVA